MATPSIPSVPASPVNPEIDPKSQAAADEASRKAKERQQKGTTATKTILTSGLEDEAAAKKTSLG